MSGISLLDNKDQLLMAVVDTSSTALRVNLSGKTISSILETCLDCYLMPLSPLRPSRLALRCNSSFEGSKFVIGS